MKTQAEPLLWDRLTRTGSRHRVNLPLKGQRSEESIARWQIICGSQVCRVSRVGRALSVTLCST
jgi:hypothetical protein